MAGAGAGGPSPRRRAGHTCYSSIALSVAEDQSGLQVANGTWSGSEYKRRALGQNDKRDCNHIIRCKWKQGTRVVAVIDAERCGQAAS